MKSKNSRYGSTVFLENVTLHPINKANKYNSILHLKDLLYSPLSFEIFQCYICLSIRSDSMFVDCSGKCGWGLIHCLESTVLPML